jgi:oleate hydratase
MQRGTPDSERPARSRATRIDREDGRFYLVGGGIASLAAAAFLIRDGDIRGCNITIIEALDRLGGSLDGAGSAEAGYVIRGGRMFEGQYRCTYDLFSSVPTLDQRCSVTREILDWNETMRTASKSRLVRHGRRVNKPPFGLDEAHIIALERLSIEPEDWLGNSRISDHFDPRFFTTNFWLMWCTTFAFQPWHSAAEFRRYLLRFAHMVSGFNQLQGIMRTVYNQYDSLVRPLEKWLDARGVRFESNTRVTDLVLGETTHGTRVEQIVWERGGVETRIEVRDGDCAIVTLGSMTEASSLGAMDRPADLNGRAAAGAWALWDKLAARRPGFGRPAVFADHIDESKWLSFTTTLREPALLHRIRDLTGNVPGEGGLVTFAESNWLMSIVVPHQPHFLGQPDDVSVLWGYGLSVDAPGNFVRKPMAACTGRDIMTELLGHLQLDEQAESLLATLTCIPCMMPFITSQFLARGAGDRPPVIPDGTANLAFVGQFCELPDDVVFTVEYSIRTAQTAVSALLGLDRTPPAVYKGQHDPRVLYRAFTTLHDA